MSRLEQLITRLTSEQCEEVADFAELLAEKKPNGIKPGRKLRLDWAGGLSDLKDQYKSGVELQHDILRMWEETD